MKETYRLDRLIVDAEVVETPVARRILARWCGAPPRVIRNIPAVVERARRRKNAFTHGKRTLLVTRRKGPFLTPCQGMTDPAKRRACCGYRILNVAENCPMDCTYCILQQYLSNPLVVLYANLDGLADEIAQARPPRAGGLLRLGTGELSDSLAFDRLTGLSLDLMRAVEPFKNSPQAARLCQQVILELKTKTTEIQNLLSVAAPANVVVSWSLNTPRQISREEIDAPALGERLKAARRCQEHGYRLGFHFDPLIHSPDWEEAYRDVVGQLFEHIDPSRIVWISLGGLRYPPAMKRTVEERFPQSTITCGELVRSWDGKLRYYRLIRVSMYRKMIEWIGERAPEVTVYLCMESPEIWEDVFGWAPREIEDVAERLDGSCWKTELAGGSVRAGDRST